MLGGARRTFIKHCWSPRESAISLSENRNTSDLEPKIVCCLHLRPLVMLCDPPCGVGSGWKNIPQGIPEWTSRVQVWTEWTSRSTSRSKSRSKSRSTRIQPVSFYTAATASGSESTCRFASTASSPSNSPRRCKRKESLGHATCLQQN